MKRHISLYDAVFMLAALLAATLAIDSVRDRGLASTAGAIVAELAAGAVCCWWVMRGCEEVRDA